MTRPVLLSLLIACSLIMPSVALSGNKPAKKGPTIKDVKAMSGGAVWKGVFLADLSDPASPRISLAREGLLVSQGPDTR